MLKTTMEALKYAVTGSLPSGDNSDEAFIHDLKGVGSANDVKAAVKLPFPIRAGKNMVVVESHRFPSENKKTSPPEHD